MTSTFTKISIAVAFVAIGFGVLGFMTNTNLFISDASAQTSCGNCGGSTGGDGGGGSDGGGDPTPETPTCTLTISKTEVTAIGESYRVTWSGGPESAQFYINGSAVADSGAANFTFTGPNYDRFRMVGNNGGVECVAEVRVNMRTTEVPRCESFTASPATLPVGGGNVTLNWDTTNATNATLNGQPVAGDGSLVVNNVTANRTFTLNLSNSVGTASCQTSVTVATPAPLPVCTLTANPTSITRGGQSTLSWTTANATSITINQGIGAVTGTSRAVNPTVTTTYTMTVTNASGSATCAATVTVVPPTPTPLPVCVLTATPASITSGNASRLTWTSQNATGGIINQSVGGIDPNNTAGFREVRPTVTTTYTLTVTNANGSSNCTATVTVTPPTPQAPICNSFTATPGTINRGQSTVLAWDTTNVSSVTINNGIGSQAADGSITVSPIESVTYTLTALGTNGQSVTCARPVTVVQPETPVTPRCEFFNVNDNTITRGETVTLSWDTTNVTSVIINPTVGSVAVDGSTNVSPSDTTTYTLTGTAANGQTVSCTRTVTVESSNGGGGGGGGSSSPKCTLKISDTKITRGDRVTITWTTSRATEVTLKDSHGKTLVTTEGKKSADKKDLYDGEITIRPEKDTTYTLLAERGSKDRTCKVSVDVRGGVTVTEVRDQKPVVTGISLTQVPYTGFEAGPFLTMMFYGLLVLWALYLAYVLVARRTSMNGLVMAESPIVPTVIHDTKVMPTNTTVSTITTPRFVAPVVASTAAVAPMVGYATTVAADTEYEQIANTIEAAAHSERVLFSGEAMRRLVEHTTEENRAATVVAILASAKASYPSEDGWVVINIDRMQSLLMMIA